MDAGLAGLIGALGGSIVGAAGASLAAMISFRGARYQADRQSQAAHEQWLRQIRRDAYANFLVHTRDGHALLRDMPQPPPREEVERLGAAVAGVHAALGALLLEAPHRVQDMAGDIHKHLHFAYVGVKAGHLDWDRERRLERARLVRGRYEAMVEECRRSLQDPEAPSPASP
ncbi:hypothetical protein ACFYU4_38760 [Streptomyces tendae]|uniref:hypothetical protein n=1 Tax=Streptomyces tendae TaxID=1932 RepID=UPI0036883E3A